MHFPKDLSLFSCPFHFFDEGIHRASMRWESKLPIAPAKATKSQEFPRSNIGISFDISIASLFQPSVAQRGLLQVVHWNLSSPARKTYFTDQLDLILSKTVVFLRKRLEFFIEMRKTPAIIIDKK